MALPDNSPKKNRPPSSFGVKKALSLGGKVGVATLFIVFVAVFGGLWLDQVLGTKPILTVILVLASAPAALALTFWLAMRAVKDIQPPSQSGKHPGVSQGNAQEEKEGGDDW